MRLHQLLCLSLMMTSPAFAATLAPPAIAVMDPMGTGCIDGGGYDDPFPSSKGIRAPAFCLPRPCDRALTRTELGYDVIGRDAEDWEWDTYYSRYAEICRAEALNADTPPKSLTERDFWAPLLTPSDQIARSAGPRRPAQDLIARPNPGQVNLFVPSLSSGTLSGGASGRPLIDAGGNGLIPLFGTVGTDTAGPGATSPTNSGAPTPGSGSAGSMSGGGMSELPVVPLPLPGLLLLAGLLGLAGARRA